jgi:NET1-associated nuclear protein 1 (U3 small nucleolar RNA-associated protein 17)
MDFGGSYLAGGGQITLRPCALVNDMVACACASKVRVYSAMSGEMLFEMHGHNDEVTQVCLHPTLSNHVYSCGKDGAVKLWNLDSGSCTSSWDIPGSLPIESISVLDDVAYVSFFWRGDDAGRILAFDLAQGQAREARVKLSTPRPIVCSRDIVATHDRHTILVWDVARFGRRAPLRLHHTKAITCVAISPDSSKIAAGDVTGRILIWHDIVQALSQIQSISQSREDDQFVEYEEPPAASVHWHAHAVGCISFSSDGRYLLSGGKEAVLVLWDVKTSGRAYLPRLGGPLAGITPCKSDPAKYCLSQSDNTVRIVNIASMIIECSIHGMRPMPRVALGKHSTLGSNRRIAPITFEGRHGHAVVVGNHSVLQFFDVSKDVHVDRLQLSRRNMVSMSGEEDNATFVEAVSFNENASLLVSVESSGSNQQLKFWDRSPEEQRQYGTPYRLNTQAENPHKDSRGDHIITDVAISAASNLVATSSSSGDFALWGRHRDGKVATWRKLAIVPGHHGDPLTSVTFSSDESLVAVTGITGAVSLWDSSKALFAGELPSAFTTNKMNHGQDWTTSRLQSPPLTALKRSLFQIPQR